MQAYTGAQRFNSSSNAQLHMMLLAVAEVMVEGAHCQKAEMGQLAVAHECCPTLHSRPLLWLELLARSESLEAVLAVALRSRGQGSSWCEVTTVQSRAMGKLRPAP